MAIRQSRRTVSLSRRLYTALVDYASNHDIAMSALTEFVLERTIRQPLDVAAFDAWFANRAHVVAAEQRAAVIAQRDAREPGLVQQRAARRAAKDARRAARAVRRAEREARAAVRAEPRMHLCTACDQPGHYRSTCPSMHGPKQPPRRTLSMSDQAAMFRARNGVTLADAAARFGVSRQAVQQREAHLRSAGVL